MNQDTINQMKKDAYELDYYGMEQGQTLLKAAKAFERALSHKQEIEWLD